MGLRAPSWCLLPRQTPRTSQISFPGRSHQTVCWGRSSVKPPSRGKGWTESALRAVLVFQQGRGHAQGGGRWSRMCSARHGAALWGPWSDVLAGDSCLVPLRWCLSERSPLSSGYWVSGWPWWGRQGGSSLTTFLSKRVLVLPSGRYFPYGILLIFSLDSDHFLQKMRLFAKM